MMGVFAVAGMKVAANVNRLPVVRDPFQIQIGRIATPTTRPGGTVSGSMNGLTGAERRVANDLVGRGNRVEIIPRDPNAIDKTPDFRINGVRTELKTLENANTGTGMKRIQQGFAQNAETVIVDARGTGMTNMQAQEMLNRAAGKFPNGQLPGKVEIWIEGSTIMWP